MRMTVNLGGAPQGAISATVLLSTRHLIRELADVPLRGDGAELVAEIPRFDARCSGRDPGRILIRWTMSDATTIVTTASELHMTNGAGRFEVPRGALGAAIIDRTLPGDAVGKHSSRASGTMDEASHVIADDRRLHVGTKARTGLSYDNGPWRRRFVAGLATVMEGNGDRMMPRQGPGPATSSPPAGWPPRRPPQTPKTHLREGRDWPFQDEPLRLRPPPKATGKPGGGQGHANQCLMRVHTQLAGAAFLDLRAESISGPLVGAVCNIAGMIPGDPELSDVEFAWQPTFLVERPCGNKKFVGVRPCFARDIGLAEEDPAFDPVFCWAKNFNGMSADVDQASCENWLWSEPFEVVPDGAGAWDDSVLIGIDKEKSGAIAWTQKLTTKDAQPPAFYRRVFLQSMAWTDADTTWFRRTGFGLEFYLTPS